MRASGFTLIELLAAVLIIGILAALGLGTYVRWRASATVVSGAQQFAQDVMGARSAAKRLNTCVEVSPVGSGSYVVGRYPTALCNGTLTQTTHALPAGVTMSGLNTLRFQPPYGTTDGVSRVTTFAWAATGSSAHTVRVSGIFGKVVMQ